MSDDDDDIAAGRIHIRFDDTYFEISFVGELEYIDGLFEAMSSEEWRTQLHDALRAGQVQADLGIKQTTRIIKYEREEDHEDDESNGAIDQGQGEYRN